MERKSHQCPNCTKSFSSSHQLAQHVRIHSNEKPYKCSVCDKSFKQLSHVQAHTRLHTGERPYHCTYDGCGRTFIQLSNLQQHQKTHSNGLEKAERSEKRNANSQNCPVCTKSYINGASLRRHIQTTHADFLESSSSAITITDSDSQSSSTTVQQVNFVLNAADLKTLKGQKITQLIASDGESNVFLIDSSDSNVFVTNLTPKLLSRSGSSKKH